MRASRWEIENFVSRDFCDKLIEQAENIGFDEATIKTPDGEIVKKNYRHNDRVIFESRDLAESLFEKIKDDSRIVNPGWKPAGLNDRFRIYRYSNPEHHFALHFDHQVSLLYTKPVQHSWVTMLIYLNEEFEGGQTSFLDGDVDPKTGLAAFMTQKNYLHRAKAVNSGTKYVLRTDIMYIKEGEEQEALDNSGDEEYYC